MRVRDNIGLEFRAEYQLFGLPEQIDVDNAPECKSNELDDEAYAPASSGISETVEAWRQGLHHARAQSFLSYLTPADVELQELSKIDQIFNRKWHYR